MHADEVGLILLSSALQSGERPHYTEEYICPSLHILLRHVYG